MLAPMEGPKTQYRLLFEASPIPTWIVDAGNGRFLVVNDAAVSRYGYARSEFLEMSIDAVRLPEETGRLSKFVEAQTSGVFIVSGLWHHRYKDGSVHRVQLSVEKIVYAGKPALLTMALDPEREGASEALKIRERQLAEGQALAHVGSWDWDIPANHASWSDEMYRIYDVPLGSPAGYVEFMARIHPEDRERVAALIADGLARGLAAFEYESRVMRPSGEVRYVHSRHVVTLDDASRPVRMAGTCVDITDRHRIQQALEDSERHHREMVENASDIVTIVKADGVIQYMSPAVHRLLGYRMEESLGHNVAEFIHSDDLPAVLEAVRLDLAAPGTPHPVEFRFRHRDGGWRVLEAIGQAHEEQPGVFVIVVNSRDITERKLAEQQQESLVRELRAARQTAETATRAKSEFLANMSHEIRTPMNAVLGLTEVVLDSELTADQRRHLEMVRDSGDVLLTLLNDILDFSKIEANHLALEEIPLDLPALLHASATLFAVTAHERGLELVVETAPDVPRFVRGDPTRLRQVLSNLIGNAIKFTHQGEIAASVRLESLVDGRANLRFAVRDSGIGIPDDRIDSLFTEFSQVDSSTTRRYGGTGLGLAIAHRLVKLMGGELGVTSAVGRGSEFAFTLSLPIEAAPEITARVPVRLAGVRILVTDDNSANRRVIREILKSAGAETDEAVTATEALSKLDRAAAEGRPYAIALLDSRMPGDDGWSLGRDIRQHPPLAGVRLLMLTSSGEVGDAARCRELGIGGYLIKPVSRPDLVEAVGSILAGREAGGVVVTRHALTEAKARLRILVAEDNAVNQAVAAAMLRKRGHLVTLVSDGAEAVAAVEHGAFDVVLMDIHMPKMDGFAATTAIRKLPGGATIPIIALTADALTAEGQHCLAAGMSGYLAKPFKSSDLIALVEGWGPPPRSLAPGTSDAAVHTASDDLEEFLVSMREAGIEEAADGILDAFVADAPRRHADLTAAIQSGSAVDIRTAAHAFKSAAGAIGAQSLFSILLAIELAAKAARVDDARALVSDMQHECTAVIDYLRGRRAGEPTHA
jgi:PAS domain S-box-containing protein